MHKISGVGRSLLDGATKFLHLDYRILGLQKPGETTWQEIAERALEDLARNVPPVPKGLMGRVERAIRGTKGK